MSNHTSNTTKRTITILAIETSADETAAAVLKMETTNGSKSGIPKTETLSSVIKSQIKLHSKMGGIVPEVSARAHVKNILPVTQKALKDAGYRLKDIDYIAVTQGPGLTPSLIVGVEFAKGLAFATGKPLIPVNHMSGHLYSPLGRANNKYQITNIKSLFPMIALIVSGGHTMLVVMKDAKNYKVIGQTVDDAAGEAFDKVAKLLGLPYPGGPEVSKLAKSAKNPVDFPRPMIHSKDYNFSFSGLKTAVLYYLQGQPLPATSYQLRADTCAGFQNAAIDVLITKTMRAVKEYGAKSISISGGVSANKKLKADLSLAAKKQGLEFFSPATGLSTDNAEMIGLSAAFMLQQGFKPVSYRKVKADSNLSL